METMSSLEFSHWIAYYGLEPFGHEVENFRAGMIASTVANVAPRKKGAKPLKPADFYPVTTAHRWTPEQREKMRKIKSGKRRHRKH